jgi:hypothetical protein
MSTIQVEGKVKKELFAVTADLQKKVREEGVAQRCDRPLDMVLPFGETGYSIIAFAVWKPGSDLRRTGYS